MSQSAASQLIDAGWAVVATGVFVSAMALLVAPATQRKQAPTLTADELERLKSRYAALKMKRPRLLRWYRYATDDTGQRVDLRGLVIKIRTAEDPAYPLKFLRLARRMGYVVIALGGALLLAGYLLR